MSGMFDGDCIPLVFANLKQYLYLKVFNGSYGSEEENRLEENLDQVLLNKLKHFSSVQKYSYCQFNST